jgi:hypothetical protein
MRPGTCIFGCKPRLISEILHETGHIIFGCKPRFGCSL